MSLTPNDLSKGSVFAFEDEIYEVLECRHQAMARRPATVSVSARHLQTGKLWSKTFASTDVLKDVNWQRISVQFLYEDGRLAHFMSPADGQQYVLPLNHLEGQMPYLSDQQTAILCLHGEQPLRLELPKNVWLKVVAAPQVIRGNTSGDLTKEVSLQTGLVVKVPGFIKLGDVVSVDTGTGNYRERQK